MYAKSYMNQKSNEIEKMLNTADSKDFELHCSTRNLFDQVIYKLTSLTDSSMTTEKRFEEILSEKRTLTSHTSKRTRKRYLRRWVFGSIKKMHLIWICQRRKVQIRVEKNG